MYLFAYLPTCYLLFLRHRITQAATGLMTLLSSLVQYWGSRGLIPQLPVDFSDLLGARDEVTSENCNRIVVTASLCG